jgi:hypothetical protein
LATLQSQVLPPTFNEGANITYSWFVEKLRQKWNPTIQLQQVLEAILNLKQGQDTVTDYSFKMRQLKGKLPNIPDDFTMAFYFVQGLNKWIRQGISASQPNSYQSALDQAIIVEMDTNRNYSEKQADKHRSQSLRGRAEKPKGNNNHNKSKHHHSNSRNGNSNGSNSHPKKKNKRDIECYGCGEMRHIKKDCPNPKN